MKERVLKNDFYEILSLTEIKDFLRISGNHDNLLVQNLLNSVVCFVEKFLGTVINKREIFLFGVYHGAIFLRKPLIEIISVKSEGVNVKFRFENVLQIDVDFGKQVEILYIAGLEEDEIMDDLKTAMLFHIAFLYDIRSANSNMPKYSLEIYQKYRAINF